MAVEIKVPPAGESVAEGMVASWLKAEGEWVALDEPVVVLETDKATVEVPAPAAGVLTRIARVKGEIVKVGDVLGVIDETAKAPDATSEGTSRKGKETPAPRAAPSPAPPPVTEEPRAQEAPPRVMPAARRVLAEAGLAPEDVPASGPGGRLLKEDVERAVAGRGRESGATRDVEVPHEPPPSGPIAEVAPGRAGSAREEEVVPMTMLRRRIAEKLVQARRDMALLTTFNEVDLGRVQALRRERGEAFQARHGVKLGLMSFFVKAAVDALKRFPVVNASVKGSDIIYHNYYDIGIAIGSGRGLVVPILRDADHLSFAAVERAIADFARRAQENRLDVEELQGGTFTISNGGVYGSLLSTPIVNPPQSAVLGLHAIQDRPVVRDGQVVVRPMMYVALSYDHRIIDGREAVSFLKHVKDMVEDPALMMLEL